MASRLHVVHVDHGLRPESGREATDLAAVTTSWGVSCQIAQAPVAEYAEAEGISIETAARNSRYKLLGEAAVRHQASYVLVAHHADDQAETVLMHLLRGSGMTGLRGMVPLSNWPVPGFEESNLTLARPLLDVWRHEIEAYCRSHHLQPGRDPSNRDLAFTRNRIRHELMPALAAFNPRVSEGLVQTARLLAADYDLVANRHAAAFEKIQHDRGPGWIRASLPGWRDLTLSEQRGTIRLALNQVKTNSGEISFEHVEQIRLLLDQGKTGQVADPGAGGRFFIYYDEFVVTSGNPTAAFDLPQLPDSAPMALPQRGTLALPNGWRLIVETGRGAENRWTAALPWPAGGRLFVRGRQPGETLRPASMAGKRVKLKELMIDRKIPAPLRDRWPLVTDGDQILWVVGHRHSAAVERPAGDSTWVTISCKKDGIS